MSDRVQITIADGVADVRLNRPDKMNALDQAMFVAIAEAGEAIKADASVRAVVLSGEGRAFCSGLDFGSFQAMAGGGGGSDTDDASATPADRSGPSARRASASPISASRWPTCGRRCRCPVIAAVHGVALGGGCQIALGADIRICAPDARFSVLEVKWGLIPDMTGTWMLPRLVGLDVAKELTFTGRMVEGPEAVALGLATRVGRRPPRRGHRAGRARSPARAPTPLRAAKRLLNCPARVPVAEQFAAERAEIGRLIGSPEPGRGRHGRLREARAPLHLSGSVTRWRWRR